MERELEEYKLMSDYIFLFDMDSTITRKEVLPEIAQKINRLDEMRRLTEATMRGEIPFRTSFLQRVKLLRDIPVHEVNKIVSEISLNTAIVDFIRQNSDRCYIVTGNLDVWISGLMKKIGMENHCYCSKADVVDDHIAKIVSVADKELIVRQFVQQMVTVGDGDNDSGMARMADIAIGFGGVREIAPSLIRNIDFAFYDDQRCADFLWKLL
ncbi:HAD-IB family phosphatase [Blautia sp. SF-50]|uniref:HAD-IB family phosphatase n=1 Tax=Blautia sp. SF-50 TaxID=1520805 RepID=UPI001FA7C484|nr:HAD-IB family phosphatase [Blautia sp. SF-50]